MSVNTKWRRKLQCITAVYSMFWLLAANCVGLWLAALLVWPKWGAVLGDLGYGRWMPLHMDWQLYGWCSLPLVGLLMAYFLNPETGSGSADAHLGFFAWSLALALEGAMSLRGHVSGKLFLNWSGLGRIVFPSAQMLLFSILAVAACMRWWRIRRFDTKQWVQGGVLLVLLASPISLFLTAGREIYPPIDPESGGATGHSLLMSTLGILFIFGLLPRLLGLAPFNCAKRRSLVYSGAFILSLAVWLALDHGNAPNTGIGQIVGLGVLLCWVPLVVAYYRAFSWPAGLRMWLRAFLFWWGFLSLSGFISFLPGVLDVMKFTNGMVAHAHLAMAGMLGAFNMLILGSLGHTDPSDPWADRPAFWLWQIGTLFYVLSMLVQGVREGSDPSVLFGADEVTRLLYMVRLFSGALLVAAALRWVALLDGIRREIARDAAQKPSDPGHGV